MMRRFMVLWCLVALFAGCTSNEVQADKEQKDENQLSTILGQLLQERPTLALYRNMMEQLNSYYDHQGVQKVMAMPAADEAMLRDMLSEVKGDFEKARRVDEVKNRFFNAFSDASYVDACLMFRDAYQALLNDMGEIPSKNDQKAYDDFNLGLVQHIHGWTSRQVALRTNPANIKDWPAHEILRLGAGEADDRLRVFISLLNQSEIDCCAVVIKTQVRQDNIVENRQVPVLAGVLIGKALYLFDPFTGRPVPGPTPGSIATYDQLKKQPALFPQRPGVPTATQIAESELVLLTPINALAPRMAGLEKDLDDVKITVKLKDDAVGRIERMKAAGYPVKAWSAPNKNGYPALVFQKYTEVPIGDPRLTEDILPHQKLIPQWALDAEKQIGLTGSQQSLFYEFDRIFIRLRLEPGGGRDLLVRGKPHQAVANLSTMENRLDRVLDMYRRDALVTVSSFRNDFLKMILERYADLRQSLQKLNTLPKDSPEAQQLQAKCNELFIALQGVWKEQNIKAAIANFGADWAIPELREHLTYFMGLAKMELAIRSELRYRRNPTAVWPVGTPTPAEQFASASEWFGRYEALIIPMKSNIWLDAVKERNRECKERQSALEKQMAMAR